MKEKTIEQEFKMDWSAEEEIQLFFALEGLKPVGVNKHFYMACIADRLSRSLKRDVPPDVIWAHLRTMYNLEVLDEMEPLPFPNEEREFALPEEFAALLSKKRAEHDEDKRSSSESNSIIAVATDNTTKVNSGQPPKDTEKKATAKLMDMPPKRGVKRTRAYMSLDVVAQPAVASPAPQNSKRRRI